MSDTAEILEAIGECNRAVTDARLELSQRMTAVETRLNEWDKRALTPAPPGPPTAAQARDSNGRAVVAGAISAGFTVGVFEGIRRFFS